ncbi:MAG: hypothetical protein ACRD2B_13115 [Terriglobia bacterium]
MRIEAKSCEVHIRLRLPCGAVLYQPQGHSGERNRHRRNVKGLHKDFWLIPKDHADMLFLKVKPEGVDEELASLSVNIVPAEDADQLSLAKNLGDLANRRFISRIEALCENHRIEDDKRGQQVRNIVTTDHGFSFLIW